MGNYEAVKTVLTKFTDTLVDLSVNEKSVHFINTQEAVFNGLYEKYEKFLIDENKSFIKQLLEMSFKKKCLPSLKTLYEEYYRIFENFPLKAFKEIKRQNYETTVKFIRYLINWVTDKNPTDYEKIKDKVTV